MNTYKSLNAILAEVQARTHTLGFRSVSILDTKAVMKSLAAVSKNGNFQLMNADLIAGTKHIQFAAANAFKAFEDGYNVARTLPTEILRYASTHRQIKDAIELLGISESTRRVAAVLIDFTTKDMNSFAHRFQKICHGVPDQDIIELSSKTKLDRLIKVYGITDKEIHSYMQFAPARSVAVINAIVERMAILSIEK